jgi:hypothetical protein
MTGLAGGYVETESTSRIIRTGIVWNLPRYANKLKLKDKCDIGQ